MILRLYALGAVRPLQYAFGVKKPAPTYWEGSATVPFPQPTLFPTHSAYGRYASTPNHPAPSVRARSSLQRGGQAAAGQGAELGGRCAGSALNSELGAAWAGGGARGEAAGGSKGGAAAAPRPRRTTEKVGAAPAPEVQVARGGSSPLLPRRDLHHRRL
jgi:hypothetical protein